MMNRQPYNPMDYSLYGYCKVMRVPRLGVVPVVITVLEGLAITLVLAALGLGIGAALAIGAAVSALFAFLCWITIRYRNGASRRFNAYLAADGGQGMFYDFASAQPFANDQFRLGRYYLFIKNGAVIRRNGIADVVRIVTNYRMVPTGVYLTVIVRDEYGNMSLPLCRVHMYNAGAEIAAIRQAVLYESQQLDPRDGVRGPFRW